MKNVLPWMVAVVFGCAVPASTFAAKSKAEPAPSAEAKSEAKKAPEKPAAAPADAAEKKMAKPLPMHARADSIDAAARSFSMKRKDGVEVKHTVASSVEIKNGEAAAKFEDIKAGDWVSGLRNKKSDTEYEVVKITKFGPKADKEADAKEAGAAKAEDAGGAEKMPKAKKDAPKKQ